MNVMLLEEMQSAVADTRRGLSLQHLVELWLRFSQISGLTVPGQFEWPPL